MAIAAVIGAQYALVTILISSVAFHEHLTRIQIVGVAITLTGVATVAALQAVLMAIASRLLPNGLDRRGIGVLAFGHLTVDSCQGLVPALMPFLIAERGYSYAQAGSLMLFSSLGSSLLQPLLGIFSDRIRATWLMWAGALVAALGMGSAGLHADLPRRPARALMVGSVGIAMFHPEAVRYANYVSRASGLRGTGMSLFAVGGTSGWALGPLLLTGAVLAVGLRGTALVALLPLTAAALLLVNGGYLERSGPTPRPRRTPPARAATAGACSRSRPASASTPHRAPVRAAGVRAALHLAGARDGRGGRQRVRERADGVRRASARCSAAAWPTGSGSGPVVVWSLAAVVPLVLALTVVAGGGRVRADGADRDRDGGELLPAGRDRPGGAAARTSGSRRASCSACRSAPAR